MAEFKFTPDVFFPIISPEAIQDAIKTIEEFANKRGIGLGGDIQPLDIASPIPVFEAPAVLAVTVAEKDRLPVKVTYWPSASPESIRVAQWLEKNMVIRNNLHLDGIEILADGGCVHLKLWQMCTPRDGRPPVHSSPADKDKLELITTRSIYCTYATFDVRYIQEIVRDMLRRHFMHEIDECLVFDGQLTFDPHR